MGKAYAVILTGYVGWGLFPLFWSLLSHVAATEVLLRATPAKTRQAA